MVSVLRPGQRILHIPSIGVSTSRRAVGGGSVPYSLSFDGSGDYVDCGNSASVMDLHGGANGFTCDIYWRTPASFPAYRRYLLAAQAPNYSANPGGWVLFFFSGDGTSHSVNFLFEDGSHGRATSSISGTLTASTWYYIRARRINGTGLGFLNKLSVNAGAEGQAYVAPGATNSTAPLQIGRAGAETGLDLAGNVCYFHLWNTNKGALASVPTSPFAVDANTAARYIVGAGSGTSLADSSGNANTGTINNATWSATVPAGWTI